MKTATKATSTLDSSKIAATGTNYNESLTNPKKLAQPSKETQSKLKPTADEVVDKLQKTDKKINSFYDKLASDPDTIGDKLLRRAIPALTNIAAGKVFQKAWTKSRKKLSHKPESAQNSLAQGLLTSMLFAGLYAAFSTFISHWSNKGTQALVKRRQNKRN